MNLSTEIGDTEIGDTITIEQADHHSESGNETLPVAGFLPEHLRTGSDWIQVTGAEIECNGRQVGEHIAQVRTAALKAPA